MEEPSNYQRAGEYKSPYEEWKESQGLDTFRGLAAPNVLTMDLKPWKARGAVSGVFINLEGTGGFNDTYVLEIPPKEQTLPWRHIYEETIYILEGSGTTSVWYEEGRKQTVEWRERSYFSLPPNAWHQHFNLSGDRPVRYVSMTAAPRVIDTFKDIDFVFDNPYAFRSKFDHEEGYFLEKPKPNRGRWDTNFVSDVLGATPTPGAVTEGGRGGGTVATSFAMVNSSVRSHSQAWPTGTHSTFHRHGPGIHVLMLKGKGYSMMGPTWEEVERVDWQPGSMFVPPEGWWHAHFNTGAEPAYFLALGWGTDKPKPGGKMYDYSKGPKEGGDQYAFADETPDIHAAFEAELAKNGAVCRMGPVHPYCNFK